MVGRVEGFGSSWQSNISGYGQQPVSPLKDVRQRVDAYDTSLASNWAETALPWMARSVLSEIGHRHYNLPKDNPFYKAIPEPVRGFAETKVSYNDIFGIKNEKIHKPEGVSWKAFLQDSETHDLYKDTMRENFSGRGFKPISPSKYLNHVVMQYNIGSIVEDLQKGRVLPAFARAIGLGTLAHEVYAGTRQAYQASRENRDSALTTVGKTVSAFVSTTIKSVTAWELGTIGFKLGESLLCIGTLPAIVAGCILGGLFEAGFKSLFNDNREKLPLEPKTAPSTQLAAYHPYSKPELHQEMEVWA